MSFEIPNYTLLDKLGEGAMAEVWLAEHKINRRKAAIKILKPAALSDENAEKLFVREGEVLASFDHPNIVRVLEQGHSGNLSYLVMECLLCGTLLQRMDPKSPPIMVAEALGLTVQIAGGLEAAHQQQVVHRDLKPANIMLRNDTTPVLTDFGIARFLDRSVSVYAQAQMIVGTVAYMSPEQATGQELDGRSDLYALGILFFELLTGRRPFPGQNFQELALQHLYAPLPQLPAELSVLQPVLDQLLAKKKEDRFPTAQAFIDALRECFVTEIALRRQVGFAGTSRAWSSQLRALGFVLDAQQTAEARMAQGEYLQGAAGSSVRNAEPARAERGPPAALARAAGELLGVPAATPERLSRVPEAAPAPALSASPEPEALAVQPAVAKLAPAQVLPPEAVRPVASVQRNGGTGAADAAPSDGSVENGDSPQATATDGDPIRRAHAPNPASKPAEPRQARVMSAAGRSGAPAAPQSPLPASVRETQTDQRVPAVRAPSIPRRSPWPWLGLFAGLGIAGSYLWQAGLFRAEDSPPTPAPVVDSVARDESRGDLKPARPMPPAPAKPTTGTLLVRTDAECALKIDGTAKGKLRQGAAQTHELASGEHQLACTSSVRATISDQQTISVRTEQRSVVEFKLKSAIVELQKIDDAKQAEQARLGEETKQREKERQAAAAQAEAARVAEEKRQGEAARLAEENRQAEAVQLAEAKRLSEAARIVEDMRRAATDRYLANGDGTVTDTETGVVWADSDNGSDINWKDAAKYCANKGVGWQLPTVAQLDGLYDESGKLTQQRDGWSVAFGVTPLIHLSSAFAWSSEPDGSYLALFVGLNDGDRYSYTVDRDHLTRALCVRRF